MTPKGRRVALSGFLVGLLLLAGCGQPASTPTSSTTAAPSSTTSGRPHPEYAVATTYPSTAHLDGSAPQLSAGDHWKERQTDPAGGVLEYDYTVQAFEPLHLGNRSYDAVRVLQHFTSHSFTQNITLWYRASDNALLRLLGNQSIGGSARTHEVVSSPPCGGAYPLRVGQSVVRSCSVNVTDATNGAVTYRQSTVLNYTMSVERVEKIHTQIGDFDAFRLNWTYQAIGGKVHTTTWWSPSVCNRVREQTDDATGSRTIEVLDYTCLHSK